MATYLETRVAAFALQKYLQSKTFSYIPRALFSRQPKSSILYHSQFVLRCASLSTYRAIRCCSKHQSPSVSLRNSYPSHHSKIIRNSSSSSQSEASTADDSVRTTVVEDDDSNNKRDYHTIIKDTETDQGISSVHEFQAETKMLLDIVAKSLYSDKEVFIRELISNASDAVEKLRYLQLCGEGEGGEEEGRGREIHISTDKDRGTFTVQDTGVGMTRQEMIDNLGTIARSGAKSFLEQMREQQGGDVDGRQIIGQFGVGFYSTFMVADRVHVYSRSYDTHSPTASTGHHWTSDGSGKYEITASDGVQTGTKIVLHVKADCRDFADGDKVKEIIKKHSNFVNCPIYLNGEKINTIQALWCMDSKDITDEMHTEFYRFISHLYDTPRYTLQYKAEVPVHISALFYVPDIKPGLFDMSQFSESGIQLYSRKILIQSKSAQILPKYLRFVKGVVDSEDIPLNLSRELLQDSTLIRRLRTVLTNRLLRYFQDQARKDRVKFEQFFADFGQFFREGIVTAGDNTEREEIGKLLRFESSHLKPGQQLGLVDYVGKMKSDQSDIYYLAAPSRVVAESSPYYEAIAKSGGGAVGTGGVTGDSTVVTGDSMVVTGDSTVVTGDSTVVTGDSTAAAGQSGQEILFCYHPYDELVLVQLQEFMGHKLVSAEKFMCSPAAAAAAAASDTTSPAAAAGGGETAASALSEGEWRELSQWIKSRGVLEGRVKDVVVTSRLTSHPCVVTVEDMAAARHFIRTQLAGLAEETRYKILQPTLQINASHVIIKKLYELKQKDESLARLCVQQLHDNAMVIAGLVDDPRTVMGRMNELLSRTMEKL